MTNGEWLDYLAHNAPDELAAWFDAEHVEHQERALDGDTAALNAKIAYPMHHGYKGVKADMVIFDELHDEHDSRDKLEADVRKIAEAYNMDEQRHGTERFEHELYCSIIHLLNRQRAIDDSICDECSSDYYEMQEEHDQMLDGIAKLMRKQPYTFDYGKPLENIETIGRYIDELTAERDELQAQADEKWNLYVDEHGRADRLATDLGRCGVEREMYRDTTTALMDCITEGLREVNAILDGKDEGLA